MLIWVAVFEEVEYRGSSRSDLRELTTGEPIPLMLTAAAVNAELRRHGATRVKIIDLDTGRTLLRSYPDEYGQFVTPAI